MQMMFWYCPSCKIEWCMSYYITPIQCPNCADGENTIEKLRRARILLEEVEEEAWKKHPLYLWAKRRTKG